MIKHPNGRLNHYEGIGKGTGLGLSQVYGFVRQSNGHVKIYSEVGEGTTVKVYLPRYTGEVDQAEEVTRAAVANEAVGAESVLIVEDDDALRVYAVEVLSDLGYSVLAAPARDYRPGTPCRSSLHGRRDARRDEWPSACR